MFTVDSSDFTDLSIALLERWRKILKQVARASDMQTGNLGSMPLLSRNKIFMTFTFNSYLFSVETNKD